MFLNEKVKYIPAIELINPLVLGMYFIILKFKKTVLFLRF